MRAPKCALNSYASCRVSASGMLFILRKAYASDAAHKYKIHPLTLRPA